MKTVSWRKTVNNVAQHTVVGREQLIDDDADGDGSRQWTVL